MPTQKMIIHLNTRYMRIKTSELLVCTWDQKGDMLFGKAEIFFFSKLAGIIIVIL